MAIPIIYNVRSVRARWTSAIVAVLGIAGRFWKDRRELDCPYRDLGRIERLWSLCEGMAAAHLS